MSVETRSESVPSPGSAVRAGRPLGSRRSFLLAPRYQLRVSVMTATVVLALLVLLNLVFYTSSLHKAQVVIADAPELADVIRSQDRVELLLVMLASAVFLAGVFVVSILETHRTAGAAFSLRRRLEEIGRGRFSARLALRKGDNLRELESTFNRMAHALQNETWSEIEELERLAARAVESGREDLAKELRALGERKRDRLG